MWRTAPNPVATDGFSEFFVAHPEEIESRSIWFEVTPTNSTFQRRVQQAPSAMRAHYFPA